MRRDSRSVNHPSRPDYPADDTPAVGYSALMTKSCTPGFFPIDDEPRPPPITRVAKPDDTVILRGQRISLTSSIGCQFIVDLSRNKERLLSDDRIIEKYDITSDAWTKITQSKTI